MPVRPFLDSSTILSGTPKYLGVIDFTGTSKTNHQATSVFNNTGAALTGKTLLLQCSAAVHILPVTTNDGTVTTATGVKLAADERVIISMGSTYGWLAAIQTSGAGNLSFWELI